MTYSCRSDWNGREITLCVDRAACWIWEKAAVSMQAVYGYVGHAYFGAVTDRGSRYCLCVTDGVNCLTASLAYNRGWDKRYDEEIGKRILSFKISAGLFHWSDRKAVQSTVSANILRDS